MRDYSFKQRKKVIAKRPIFICGLPDSGLVAKIAVDHVIEFLKASRIGDIYSPYLPPQVLVRDNGVSELTGHQVYYDGKQDLVIYTGDSQPVDGEGAYKLSEFIVKLAKQYRAREIIILAALIKGAKVEDPQVVASAESEKHLDEYTSLGVRKTGTGSITWMHGLILGEAVKVGMKAVCLSGETKGDVPDPKAATALLKVIEKRLGISLDTSKLGTMKSLGQESQEAPGPEGEEKKGEKPSYIG